LTRFFFPGSIRNYLIPQPNHTEIATPRPFFLRPFGSETWIVIALVALGADEDSIKSVNPAVVYARAGGLGAAGPQLRRAVTRQDP